MIRTLVALAAALSLPTAAAARAAATAEVKDATGRTVATATFDQVAGGVRVTLVATALPPGPHGFHVHAAGRCDPPDFATTGGHFDPTHRHHGLMNPAGHHLGDMPNLVVGADGRGTITAELAGATLDAGPTSLFHPGGTSLVIHRGADDMMSDPAGNSGPKIACGVVVRAR